RSCSDVLTGTAGDADAPPVLVLAVADPGRLAVAVEHHHVADVDRGLLGPDPAGLGPAGGGGDPGGLLHPGHPLDGPPVLLGQRGDHLALGALVLAGDDQDGVALLPLHSPASLRSPAE